MSGLTCYRKVASLIPGSSCVEVSLGKTPSLNCFRRAGCRPAWSDSAVNVCMNGCKTLCKRASAKWYKCKLKVRRKGGPNLQAIPDNKHIATMCHDLMCVCVCVCACVRVCKSLRQGNASPPWEAWCSHNLTSPTNYLRTHTCVCVCVCVCACVRVCVKA